MTRFKVTHILYCLSIIIPLVINQVKSQRNLLHLKQDLDYRLNSYWNQRRVIDDILKSSIYPSGQALNGQGKSAFSVSRVRFSDLVIPDGSLILDRHIAQPTVRILINKTMSYVNSKMNELYQVQNQLDNVKRQLDAQQYIYKGLPNTLTSQSENPNIISGTRIFKQFSFGQRIESPRVVVKTVNHTDVDRVLNDTYMANTNIGLVDKQSRLFFEGRKTFWRSTFTNRLNSGCCDRMKPLHTDRMMLRHAEQDISAPVMIHSSPRKAAPRPVLIRALTAGQLSNRAISPDQDGNRIAPTQVENLIHLNNLIHIKLPNQTEISKTIIFKDLVKIYDVQLFDPLNARGLVIGLADRPELYDLNLGNYMLRSSATPNSSELPFVSGKVVITGYSHFLRGLDGDVVNGIPEFGQYINGNVVRLNENVTIRGSVYFTALPAVVNPPDRIPNVGDVPIMFVHSGLNVGRVNGLRIPEDLIFLPPSPLAYKFGSVIRISGPKIFKGQVVMKDLVQVDGLINGIPMPYGVIPLHLNDFMSSVGSSNLWFVDGIAANQMTVQSGQFDEISIRDSDTQNIFMRSVFVPQSDGSHFIRAPLRISNLRMFARRPDQGLLNGFRPQGLLELLQRPIDATIAGLKTFVGPVEADECVFHDLNSLSNWPNHLIRIDRPNLIQNVHTRLAFSQPLMIADLANSTSYLASQLRQNMSSSIAVDHFRVEFHQDDLANHMYNWNFSPEFYVMRQALIQLAAGTANGRYRVIDQVVLINQNRSLVNGVSLNDIVLLTEPFRFAQGFVMVGKVSVASKLRADRITSNYPLDVMDLVQFSKLRIPTMGSRSPIRLTNLVLSTNNRAAFVQSRMINGISFTEFASSIWSLTRPQVVKANIVFKSPVSFEGMIRTGSSFNGIRDFREFTSRLKNARYTFEDGLQCNSVIIKT